MKKYKYQNKGGEMMGENKKAIYCKKHRELHYWTERNVLSVVACATWERAKMVIKMARIPQDIRRI